MHEIWNAHAKPNDLSSASSELTMSAHDHEFQLEYACPTFRIIFQCSPKPLMALELYKDRYKPCANHLYARRMSISRLCLLDEHERNQVDFLIGNLTAMKLIQISTRSLWMICDQVGR